MGGWRLRNNHQNEIAPVPSIYSTGLQPIGWSIRLRLHRRFWW